MSEQRQNGGKRVGSHAGQPRAVTQPGRTDTDEDPLPSQRQQSANRFPWKRSVSVIVYVLIHLLMY